MSRILAPLPDLDFDVTEIAVPWKLLTRAGHEVVFATENGAVAAADPKLLTGVLFGQLGADPEPKAFYAEMIQSPAFQKPLRWADLDMTSFDGMLLTGGHAKGMRQYLASEVLQAKVAEFFGLERPVGAICHGVLLAARSKDPQTGKSVLHKRRTTCLPKYMERTAYFITAWKLGDYYRTYPEYVEDEVKAALEDPAKQFVLGSRTLMARGTEKNDAPAMVVEDGNYVSARWPGDAYLYAKKFIGLLESAKQRRAG